ncbi:hypothetical protein HZS_777 [Henneguya salminicola]|nr:hypothetical protein HZS_777 [Henneguya salminicola]
MWSSDEGLGILRMGNELFIDATFRGTPHPFVQCLIAFKSRINEYLYCELLHAIIAQLKYVWCPKSVVVDFEKALLNSIKYSFP